TGAARGERLRLGEDRVAGAVTLRGEYEAVRHVVSPLELHDEVIGRAQLQGRRALAQHLRSAGEEAVAVVIVFRAQSERGAWSDRDPREERRPMPQRGTPGSILPPDVGGCAKRQPARRLHLRDQVAE